MDLRCKINKSKSEGINEMYPVWLKNKTYICYTEVLLPSLANNFNNCFPVWNDLS